MTESPHPSPSPDAAAPMLGHTASAPSMDSQAAARWQRLPLTRSPWLHEEIAQRMQERLQWITVQPRQWLHWQPLHGGVAVHGELAAHYPEATAQVWVANNTQLQRTQAALRGLAKEAWWQRLGASLLQRDRVQWHVASDATALPDGSVDMVWANMQLHTESAPHARMTQWSKCLSPQGFVMFSALGPDSLQELRSVYVQMGWAPPCHTFTDMHDYGDMLLESGFAAPVMDMERITLTYANAESVVADLRSLGRNLSVQRDARPRGKAWRQALIRALATHMPRSQDGQLQLTFEVVYGHAFKAAMRAKVAAQTDIGLEQMRQMLRKR